MKTEKAVKTLKKAFKDDPMFAYSWHCNIAMMCMDAINAADVTAFDEYTGLMCPEDAHTVGNDAASRFMKLAFDIETAHPGPK